MLNVRSMEEALALLCSRFSNTKSEPETVPLARAVLRVLAGDILSPADVPAFCRSTVDGYAVKASDTFGASEVMPAVLRCIGAVTMGEMPDFTISDGECAYVPTGGALPSGADAMVMLEYVSKFGQTERAIEKSAAPGQNLIFRGDDIQQGETLLAKGRVLRAAEIGALAAAGFDRVPVASKLRAAVLSTGDELVPPGQSLPTGRVYDSNAPMLLAGLTEAGTEAHFLGVVPDEPNALQAAVAKAASGYDLVLLSGGSSAGERDYIAAALSALGTVLFHGLAVKPGKPTLAGEVSGVPVIGLPGHPMAAYFMFRTLVRPLLAAMQGAISPPPVRVSEQLACDVPANHGRTSLVPVRLEAGTAIPLAAKSGLIRRLTDADGYIAVPREREGMSAGETVEVILF